MDRLQVTIPALIPTATAPTSGLLKTVNLREQQIVHPEMFGREDTGHQSVEEPASVKQPTIPDSLHQDARGGGAGIDFSSSWFLNTVQLTPPYSPGNCSSLCGRDSASVDAERHSEPQLKIQAPTLTLDTQPAAPTSSSLKQLTVSDTVISVFPSPGTPKVNAVESEHSGVHSFLSPAALEAVSYSAIAALASFPPAPPCCLEHSKENLANPDRDSEASLITPECVGHFTCDQGIEIPSWAVGMTGKELEIRTKILKIQQDYRNKQKEVLELRKKMRRTRKKPAIAKGVSKTLRRRVNSAGSTESFAESAVRSENEHDAKEFDGNSEKSEESPLLMEGKEKETHVPEEEGVDQMTVPAIFVSDQPETLEEQSLHEETTQEREKNESPHSPPDTCNRTNDSYSCRPDPSDLETGLRLILLDGGLFYPGTLEVLDAEALLYGVSVDGQRASRPYVLCQEELLSTALKEVPVDRVLPGDRVCAFWSGQIRALYPGSVTECESSSKSKSGEQLVTINFDDGDSGQIRISDVRSLPRDFPITKVESPVLPAFITRKRNSRTVDSSTAESGFTEVKVPRRNSLSKKHKSRSNSEQKSVPVKFWEWEGPAEYDSKKRLPTYKAIRRGSEIVNVGDLVQVRSDARFGGSRSPTSGKNVYVGFVRKFWETKLKIKRVRVAWCYRSNEVEPPSSVKQLQWADRAVFYSAHEDDNSVETISSRCEFVSWTEFHKLKTNGKGVGDGLYYLAGSYDPVHKRIKMESDLTDHH